jgi:hypothetical protein
LRTPPVRLAEDPACVARRKSASALSEYLSGEGALRSSRSSPPPNAILSLEVLWVRPCIPPTVVDTDVWPFRQIHSSNENISTISRADLRSCATFARWSRLGRPYVGEALTDYLSPGPPRPDGSAFGPHVGSNRVPATTFVITHSPSRSSRRDWCGLRGIYGGRSRSGC